MAQPDTKVAMTVQVALAGEPPTAELDRLTRRLSSELEQLGADAQEQPARPGPPGTKGDAVTIGTVALAIIPPLLPKLVDFLRGWRQRDEGRLVKLTTVVGGRTVELTFSPEAPPSPAAITAFLAAAQTPPSDSADQP